MEKVFDAHVHLHFDIRIDETVELLKKEFAELEVVKYAFLSIPVESKNGITLEEYPFEDEKALFLKKEFSPNAYAFPGLIHPKNGVYDEKTADYFLAQAKEFRALGADGIKMLEGYPQFRKAIGVKLCDEVYDKFYSYLEEHGTPIIMHVANPEENWDADRVSEYAKSVGRFCDETFPTKDELTDEVFGILKKHPKLKLALAHFGFMSYDINEAKAFLDDYENTMFDLTPGGEQLINMSKDWGAWHEFFVKYQDRIFYGTDQYAFPYTTEEEWRTCFTRRPKFLRQFFETDGEHVYTDEVFRGVNLEKELRDKIYRENAERWMGEPAEINVKRFIERLESLLKEDGLEEKHRYDLEYMLNALRADKR